MSVHQAIEAAAVSAMPKVWKQHVVLLGALAFAILALFFADAADMVSIWWNSSSYGHCLIVLPIIGWLVWHRREQLMQLTPGVSLCGLPFLTATAALWVLGEATDITLFRHAALVGMLQAAVVTTLGLAIVRALLFPLFYALFLIPFGDEIVPALQLITADISMYLLGLAGLPAHIEGIYITTPSGLFRVAEACSGVRFLIAMIALGALAANLCFKSWPRRISFMAACLIVPIVANGFRAFGTIYIADRTGLEFAASFDHVFYGWVFFAIVIALVLAMGWRFFDREIDDPAFDPEALRDTPNGPAVAPLSLGIATLAIVAMALMAGAAIGRGTVQAPVDRVPSLTD